MKDKTKGISLLIILGIIYGYVMSILLSLGSSLNDRKIRFVIIMIIVIVGPMIMRWVANKFLSKNRFVAGCIALFTGVIFAWVFYRLG